MRTNCRFGELKSLNPAICSLLLTVCSLLLAFVHFVRLSGWQAVQVHAPGALRGPRHPGVLVQADHSSDRRAAVCRAARPLGRLPRRQGHVGGHALWQARSHGRERRCRVAGLVVHRAFELFCASAQRQPRGSESPSANTAVMGDMRLIVLPDIPDEALLIDKAKLDGTNPVQARAGHSRLLQELVAHARQPVPSTCGPGSRAG